MVSPSDITRGAFDDWAPDLQKARVYEQILLDIILGALPPGARLDEQSLVERYGAGLAGVRDALGRLALEGLVLRRSRSGTTVSPLDIIEVRQAYEARALLEPHVAAQAALNATAEDVSAMEAAFEGADEIIRNRDSRGLIAMDQRFHVAVARASRNATLGRILIPLQHKAARFWVYSMSDDTEQERRDEIDRHHIITDCIARGDADGARRAMEQVLGVFTETVRRTVATPTLLGGASGWRPGGAVRSGRRMSDAD